MIIYKTINQSNGKIYIGQDSKNDPYYLGSGILLKKAIKKYGKENFRKKIVEYCDSIEELNQREIYWIEFYNSTDRYIGYNLTQGGSGCLGLTPTQETKRKMSKAQKGRKKSKETIQNMSKAQKGRKKSKEHKEKLRQANLGKKHSKLTKRKMSQNNIRYWKGKHLPKITRMKISNSLKGKKQSKETILKRSKSLKGKRLGFKHSKTTIQKIGISCTKYDIPKDKLFELYIIKNKTMKEIAQINKCCIGTIKYKLKKYKIRKRR